MSELLSKIDKNDAIFTGSINRYCLLAAECKDIEKSIKKIKKNMLENSKKYKSKEINYESYINIQGMLETKSIQHDKQLQTKRKMMFDIEKENLMTIAGSLRCVPKRVTKETKSDDDLFD